MNRPTALKAVLEQRPAETTVKRMWQDIEIHRYRQERPIVRRAGWIMAAAAVSAVAVAVILHLPFATPDSLMLANGGAMPETVTGPRASSFRFADGSRIDARPHTHFDMLINRKTAIEFALRKGAMSIQVTPGGERRWTIHCGEVDVIVVGTAFEVIRSDRHVEVKVHRGKVCVKGATVPDGIQMLTASKQIRVASATVQAISKSPLTKTEKSVVSGNAGGQASPGSQRLPDSSLHGNDSIVPFATPSTQTRKGTEKIQPNKSALAPEHSKTIAATNHREDASGAQVMSADAIAPLAGTSSTNENPARSEDARIPSTEKASGHPWKQYAQSGKFEAAYRALPAFTFSTLNATQWSPDDLFLLSDVARITRHPNEACAALRELIRRYPNNPRAGIAAYTLARVTTESLHQPNKGSAYYQQALELGISKALRETALIRLMEHYRHIAPHKARHYENIYIAEYPRGRYLEEINKHPQATKP